MKSRIAQTVSLAVLVLGLAAVAQAQPHRCTNPGLTGAWAYTETGSVVLPAAMGGATVPAAAVGRYDFEADGTFTGVQVSSAGGAVSDDLKKGTYALGADCRATLTLEIYDPTGTTLKRRSVWEVVLGDNATEMRGIMRSMTLPNGVAIAPIMTFTAKRLFRDQGHE